MSGERGTVFYYGVLMTREGDPKQRASIGPLSCIANSNGNQSELEIL